MLNLAGIPDCHFERIHSELYLYNFIRKYLNRFISSIIILHLWRKRDFIADFSQGRVMNTLKLLDNSVWLRQILQKHEMNMYTHFTSVRGLCYILLHFAVPCITCLWNSSVISHHYTQKTPPKSQVRQMERRPKKILYRAGEISML